MKRRLVLGLFALAVALAPALRAQDVPDGKWWKRPRLAEEIGLTAEQQDQIEKIFVRSRTKLIDLRADLEKKQLLLREAMEDASADRRDVERKIEAVENARADLQKTRALMILDMKQVLKPAQWEKLRRWQQAAQERRQEFRERLRDRVMGRGGNQPPKRNR